MSAERGEVQSAQRTLIQTRSYLHINNNLCINLFEWTAEVETFYIRKGANGTLPCLPVSSADSQDTLSRIEWFKEDRRLLEAEEKRIVVWNTKNSIAYLPETGALLFRGVSNEDSGEYHCLLTKPKTGETEDGIVRFYVQGKYHYSASM